MSLTKPSQAGNNLIMTSRLGTGKSVTFFYIVSPRLVNHLRQPSPKQKPPRNCPHISIYIFLYIFCGLQCVEHFFAFVAHFVFERFLDSNSKSCRSKQARYQLSHPSPCFKHVLQQTNRNYYGLGTHDPSYSQPISLSNQSS